MLFAKIVYLILAGVFCGACEEYCISDTFSPKCRKNEVIIIQQALFGRQKFGKCLKHKSVVENTVDDPKIIGCYSDIKAIIGVKCDGLLSCEIPVAKIEEETPCNNDLKHYLEASYTCVKVIPETHDCKVSVESDKQHISSAQTSSCGNNNRPWKVSSMAGQRINISLLQLKSDSYDQQQPKKTLYFMEGTGQGKPPCHVYGVIREESSRRNVFVCYDSRNNDVGNFDGESILHRVSSGNEIEVHFEHATAKEENRTTFLISLEATGCTDLMVPEDAFWKRDGNVATVGCHMNLVRWTLNCDGKKWDGVVGNCSHANTHRILTGEVKEKQADREESSSMLIPIVSIVMAGLVLSFCIICVGVVLLNRYYAMSKKRALKQMSMGPNSMYNNNSYIMQTANKAYYDAQQQRNNNNNMMMMMTNNNNNNNMIMTMDKQDEAYFAGNSQLNPDTAQYFELDQALVGKEAPAMA